MCVCFCVWSIERYKTQGQLTEVPFLNKVDQPNKIFWMYLYKPLRHLTIYCQKKFNIINYVILVFCGVTCGFIRALVMSAYQKINFLISKPKHMFKLMVKKIFTILLSIFLYKPMFM